MPLIHIREESDISGIKQFPVPLVTAEATLTITAANRGKNRNKVILSFAPAAFTGNTPGVQMEVVLPLRSAMAMGEACMATKAHFDQGIGLVEGQGYGRLPLLFNDGASGRILLFVTADDLHTIAMAIADAAEYARGGNLRIRG